MIVYFFHAYTSESNFLIVVKLLSKTSVVFRPAKFLKRIAGLLLLIIDDICTLVVYELIRILVA